MKLKFDAEGHVIIKDGMPVYEYDDGSEHPFDAAGTLKSKDAKIEAQAEEIDRHFKKAKKAVEELKKFDGVDLKIVKENAEFVEKFKDAKLVDEQGIEALKKQMNMTHQEEMQRHEDKWKTSIEEQRKENEDLRNLIYKQTTLNMFATSPLFTGENAKIKLHPEYAASIYGNNVKTEIDKDTGKVIHRIVDGKGNIILSKKNHGDEADFSEGLEILIDSDPRKDTILNPGLSGGPGAEGNIGANQKDFKDLTPQEKIKAGLKKFHRGKSLS